MLEKIHQTVDFLKQRVDAVPDIGIILGTGLGGLINEIEAEHVIDYPDIPNFPLSTVDGHEGQLVFGKLGSRNVIAMKGRFHFYEGYTMEEITFPIRVMKFMGAKLLVISSAP